jgi:hypothetical protein
MTDMINNNRAGAKFSNSRSISKNTCYLEGLINFVILNVNLLKSRFLMNRTLPLVALIFVFLLAACSSPTEAPFPTLDQSEVDASVNATLTAMAPPPDEPTEAPTQVPPPSDTPVPIPTPTQVPIEVILQLCLENRMV